MRAYHMVKTGLLAAALAVGFGAVASAQSVEVRTSTPGAVMHDDGDVSTTRVIHRRTVERRIVHEPSTTATIVHRGASYYAPGHVKKRVIIKSTRDGDDDDATSTTIVHRRVHTID